jgi:hypothetical protein
MTPLWGREGGGGGREGEGEGEEKGEQKEKGLGVGWWSGTTEWTKGNVFYL